MSDTAPQSRHSAWRAHDELPESVVGYGTAEIAYILSCHTDAQIEQTRAALAYDLEQVGDDIITAGASSLLARGQAQLTDTDLQLVGPASLLEYVFAFAGRWTHIGLHDRDTIGIDALIYVQAPHQAVLLQPRAVDTLWAVFTRTHTAPSAILHPMIANHTATYPDGTAFIDTKTRETSHTCFVRPHGYMWEWATVTDPATEPEIVTLTIAQLAERIDTMLDT